MRSRSILMSGVLGGALVIGCAVASATPPVAGAPAPAVLRAAQGAALVGRVRTRDQIIDLTAASLASGGAAHALVQSVAHDVHADVDHDLVKPSSAREANDSAGARGFERRAR